jgi:fatty acid desaturase
MHHVGHRGYDKVPGVPPEYTSRVFARGKRRRLDWNDWMVPEAWIYEHNVLHHAHTGEEDDPDLVERNTEDLRTPRLPKLARYATVALLGATWRVSYYAPKTIATWMRRHGPVEDAEVRKTLVWQCYVPYALWHFAALPAAYLPLGPWAAASALVNSIAADVLTNMHTFFVVGPNHTGDDVYRFDARPRSRAEHVVRQVVGSVNYRTGGDVQDYLHLFLNYQIEHHLFPDLPMRQYQRIQPEVRAICEEHGVPYVQEGVVARFKKLVSVIVGDAKMRRVRDIAAGVTAA